MTYYLEQHAHNSCKTHKITVGAQYGLSQMAHSVIISEKNGQNEMTTIDREHHWSIKQLKESVPMISTDNIIRRPRIE